MSEGERKTSRKKVEKIFGKPLDKTTEKWYNI